MFRYKELLRLKTRDFELWAWKAQRVLIEEEMRSANLIRAALGTNDRYRRWYNERENLVLQLDGKLKERHKAAWAELKLIGKG